MNNFLTAVAILSAVSLTGCTKTPEDLSQNCMEKINQGLNDNIVAINQGFTSIQDNLIQQKMTLASGDEQRHLTIYCAYNSDQSKILRGRDITKVKSYAEGRFTP